MNDATLLRLSGRWLQALTEGSEEVIALCDRSGTLQYMSVSNAVHKLTGYGAVELGDKAVLEILHPEDARRAIGTFRRLAAQPGAREVVEYRIRHRSGRYVRVQSTGINRLDDDVVAAIVIHTREAHVEEESAPSSVDPGGRLRDRTAFRQKVNDAVGRAHDDDGYGFSVLIVELEHIKMLVGNYGQEVVDELLAEVAARVASLLRPEDTLGELGGGEFAVLIDGVSDRRRAARVAERIQKTIGMRFELQSHTITTSAIVGIATSERRYERAEHVMRDAALAANRARGTGLRKRRAVFQTQMRVEDTRYMSTVAELHNALQADQFRLHYQPVVSLATRTLAGFEALIRWYHPERGIIQPAEFIPVAEETGLIVPMGKWAIEEACRQMVRWQLRFRMDPPLSVSVNVSGKQFAEDDVAAQVEEALSKTGLGAHQLKLEITESAVLDNKEQAVATLARLKRLGVQFSLDDFGTGYSSFSYLHQLPYDTLKIDRSFVSRVGDSGENTEIIHAIIVLAHNLRMDVVAEGVETPHQAAQLKNMWCEYAQGYFFSKPLDEHAAAALIESYPRW